MKIIGIIALLSLMVTFVTAPEHKCPPEELRPAVYDRSWPVEANALACEHALMTGQPLGKECA